VDGVAHPLHVCLSHATFARQTYDRKPKSTGRSNKARIFGDVCAPPSDAISARDTRNEYTIQYKSAVL